MEHLSKFFAFLIFLDWELIISCISLFVSIYVLISTHLKSCEKYEISIVDYSFRFGYVLQLLVVFTNHSDSPLTIKSVFCDGTICELEPKKIRGNPGSFGFVSTPQFPLCIPAHGCQYAYLEFLSHQYTAPVPGTTLNLEICSTRKSVQKTVLLGGISHYLHTKSQFQAFQDPQQNK